MSRMPGYQLMRDQIVVVKPDGSRSGRLRASLQPTKALFQSPDVPVEDGDTLIRELPDGRSEEYLVVDSGFRHAIGSFPDHYQSKIKKKSAIATDAQRHVVYNVQLSGENARFNLNSIDLSSNVVDVQVGDLFAKIKQVLSDAVEDAEERASLLRRAAELESAVRTPTFVERYKAFVSSAADHMALLAPFLPALTQLL